MADPVYLEPGISDSPTADANPQGMGLTSTLGQQVAEQARGALDELPSQGIYDYAMTHLGLDPMISGDEANQRFGIMGDRPENTLQWRPDEQVGIGQATQMQKAKADQIQENYVMSGRPNDFGTLGPISYPTAWRSVPTWAASIGTDLLGGVADPTNVAFSVIPESALGRVSELAAKVAGTEEAAARAAQVSSALSDTVIGRMANAGINNAAGVALLQPIIQAGEEQDHQDYGWAQAGQNILFGGLLGAGLHGVGEAFSGLAGATWRAGMRSGVASLDTKDSAALMNQDLANADPVEVTKQLMGAEPFQPQEETPNFKNWFGDWQEDPESASKVVDENGSPLEMYHGTSRAGFTEFKVGKTGALYFSSEPADAAGFANKGGAGQATVPAYISIKNPFEVAKGETGDIIYFKPHRIAELKAQGYDGVIDRNNWNGVWVAAFDPRQIKSSKGNSGAFDPNSADITDGNSPLLPHPRDVARETQARQSQIYYNVRDGKYQTALPEREPINEATLPPDEIADLAQSGKFDEAAPAMAAHVGQLEGELGLDLSPDEKEQVNQPVEKFNQLKSIIGDFTDCVAQEAA